MAKICKKNWKKEKKTQNGTQSKVFQLELMDPRQLEQDFYWQKMIKNDDKISIWSSQISSNKEPHYLEKGTENLKLHKVK